MTIYDNILTSKYDILRELDAELRKQGFAGSTDIPKIVFLTAITRMFDEPVSLVVMGPSGGGKTYSIESGLQFVPPAAIVSIAGMSEKALPYLSGPSLKNKILYLGEASGMSKGEGRTFLRQLMTENKLDYLTVQKTANGMKGEKLPTVEGPISFMMATTANHIHHEDQSRMLNLNIEEDHEKIRQALRNKALGLSKADVPLDLAPWHELHEHISTTKMGVHIPFAERIVDQIPIQNFKIQRDFPKFLSLMRACALVHFNQREVNNDNIIIANRYDYESVYNLLNKPISEGLENSVKDGIRNVVQSVHEIYSLGGSVDGISQSKLAEHMKMDRSVVGRNLHAAISQGYLIDQNPGQGRESKVIVGDRKLPSGNALPSPDEVFEQVKIDTKAEW